MKSFYIKSALFLALAAGVTSCVNNDDYTNPLTDCVSPNLVANKTIAEINAIATTTPTQYTGDDIIEGYVSSSDEKGNIYKFIYIQPLTSEGTPIGIAIPHNLNSSYGEGFYPGRKVFVKLKDLYIAKVDSGLSIGQAYYQTPTSPLEIGRISELDFKKILIPACETADESQIVRSMTMGQAINNANLNTLIELTDVQFSDGSIGRRYYDVDSGGGATNHIAISNAPGQSGQSVIVRFSSYAAFVNQTVPSGSGTIRGVLTKYGSDFQFMVRYADDINLTGPRFDANPPIGGSNIVYTQTLNETFESFAATSGSQYLGSVFPGYVNDAATGSRYWDVKSFSGNKYVQMSAFNSNQTTKTFLIFPVQMTAGYKFSFKSKDGYNDGAALRVYYSTDYVPGGVVADATLVDITSSFAISSGSTSGYATNFTDSGNFTIPAGLGNGFFLFEYSGQDDTGVTTTMQIDDVRLTP